MEKQIINEKLLRYCPKTSLTVISVGRVVSIGFDELVHIRKFGCEVVIYTGSREYRTRYSLQDILNELPVNDFFRVHKSHIISLCQVKTVEKNRIRVGDKWLPFSGYYRTLMTRHQAQLLNTRYTTLSTSSRR